MPRRREVPKREVPLDPIYSSSLVTKFISTLMSDGKRSTAERIMYGSLSSIQEKTGDDPLEGIQEGGRERQARARSEVAPRRRLELPGAGRSEPEPPALVEHPLAGWLRALARRRQDDAGEAGERTAWTRRTCAAARSRSAKTSIAWRRPIRRSRTIAGNEGSQLPASSCQPERTKDLLEVRDS